MKRKLLARCAQSVLLLGILISSAAWKFGFMSIGYLSVDFIPSGHHHVEGTSTVDENTNISSMSPISNLRLYPCMEESIQKINSVFSCVHFFKENGDITCHHEIVYKTQHGETPMCIYDPKVDIYVSGSLKGRGNWEYGLVRNAVNILKTNPNFVFLDVGCNIGTYTIAMAKMGRKVISIDPMLENLRLLSNSLKKGNIMEDVTLLWNAVSNKRQQVIMKNDTQPNVGGTAIRSFDGEDKGDLSYVSQAVTLDDMLPLFEPNVSVFMKIDIEGHELNAFLGAKRFFEVVDVRYIQMETLLHGNTNKLLDSTHILNSKGFKCYRDILKKQPLSNTDHKKWPTDVYFVKN